MLKIRIDKATERKLLRNIKRFKKGQIPYTASLAINELGIKAGQDIGKAAGNKEKPGGNPDPAERQARYLYFQIKGWTDTRNKAIPARGYPLNQYGNLPRRATK